MHDKIPRGHLSSVVVPNYWYIAARSSELKNSPITRTIFSTPLVLFRDQGGRAACFLDRCPHRNVPLSIGRIIGNELECAYHGWRFGCDGVCSNVPALPGVQQGKARRVPVYAALEQQGYVWVYMAPDLTPATFPYRFRHTEDTAYVTVRYDFEMPATLHASAENALDVPHTAFLHRGLFRGGKKKPVVAVVRRHYDRVEAEYVGEPSPKGLLGKILAPGGGTLTHFDRFLLPSVAEVEYALGEKSHMLIASVMTPVSDFVTRMYNVVSLRLPFGAWFASRLAIPAAKKVLRQDAHILGLQMNTVRDFDGEQFVSTDVDILGPSIWRLLKMAAQNDLGDPAMVKESRVDILV